MHCRYCHKDADDCVILVPESADTADLSQSAFACLSCSIEHGIFCVTHDRPHQAFEGGKHLCLVCIEEERLKLVPYAGQISKLMDRLVSQLPEEQIEDFQLQLAFGAYFTEQGINDQLLRWVTTKILLLGGNINVFIEFLNNPTSGQSPLTLQ